VTDSLANRIAGKLANSKLADYCPLLSIQLDDAISTQRFLWAPRDLPHGFDLIFIHRDSVVPDNDSALDVRPWNIDVASSCEGVESV